MGCVANYNVIAASVILSLAKAIHNVSNNKVLPTLKCYD